MMELLASPAITIIDVTPARARLAAEAFGLWGKRFHKASPSFGGCFAYAIAREFGCPLPCIGNDFARTVIPSAIAP